MVCMPKRILRDLPLLAACLALAAISAARAEDYPQIRLNTDTTTELQNEQQICVNPTDPNNVVACRRDFRLGYRQVGVGYSFDGGYNWTDYLIGGDLPWDSDPVLIVDDDGMPRAGDSAGERDGRGESRSLGRTRRPRKAAPCGCLLRVRRGDQESRGRADEGGLDAIEGPTLLDEPTVIDR